MRQNENMCEYLSLYPVTDPRFLDHWVLTDRGKDNLKIYTRKRALTDSQLIRKEGFELKENDEFIKYDLSHTGTPVRSSGKYKIEGDILYTRFKNQYLDSAYRIVEINDNLLKIK